MHGGLPGSLGIGILTQGLRDGFIAGRLGLEHAGPTQFMRQGDKPWAGYDQEWAENL